MAGDSICYATVEDLDMIGLPTNVTKSVDAPIKQRHLEVASGVMDSYLRSQYEVPLVQDETSGQYPPEIVTCCTIIAAFSLMQFIGYNPNSADIKFQQRYHDMVGNPNVSGSAGWLDKVSTGAVSLDLASDATPSIDEGAPVIFSNPERGWYVSNAGAVKSTKI